MIACGRNRFSRVCGRALYSDLVRGGLLYEHAGQLLIAPFGSAAFYLKSVAPPKISLTDIFKGFLPFIALKLLALSVLLISPSIVKLFL